MADLENLIGVTATLPVKVGIREKTPFDVTVRIIGVARAFGRELVRITPVSGNGERQVNLSSLHLLN